MFVSFLVIWWLKGTTMRLPLTLCMFYPTRNVLQAIFLMGRPVGDLFYDPGFPSLTVPYFDTNDFYYSGHVGVTTIFASEYLAMRWNKMSAFCIILVIDCWFVLMLVRTHYVIDFTTGYAVSRMMHRIAEKLSYYPDVKLCGYAREKRFTLNYDPCPKCGWGNKAVLRLTTPEEVKMQKEIAAYQMRQDSKLMTTDNEQGSESPLVSDEAEEEAKSNKNKFVPSINNYENMGRGDSDDEN